MDIVPQTVLAQNNADFAIAWVPKALQSREQGAGITDIAQIFQRSGTLQVSKQPNGITDPAALKGKKVGNWGFGNEFELFAGMTEAGLDPAKDVTLVQQQFDMQALLKGEIDAAQAMIYNEYAQVLEAKNPDTGELYTADDFAVINWNDVGTAMLQDAIWANSEKLASDPEYKARAEKFVKASMKGWMYCRDNPEDCVDIVLAKGSKLGKSHQLWQMNEINKLDLALARRHRPHRPGRVGPDGQGGAQHQERRRLDGHHQGARRRGVHERDRQGRAGSAGLRGHHRGGLQAPHGDPQRGRRLTR